MDQRRSEQMSRIRAQHTEPEVLLRKALWACGLRYRLHVKTPAGKPDIVFPRARIAIFIDGCFWHGCPEHYVRPRSRTEFWSDKLRENVLRDIRQTRNLEGLGWRLFRVWEHEVFMQLDELVTRVRAVLGGAGDDGRNSWRVVRVLPVDTEGELERRTLIMLRDETRQRVERQKRHTRKWNRPSRGPRKRVERLVS